MSCIQKANETILWASFQVLIHITPNFTVYDDYTFVFVVCVCVYVSWRSACEREKENKEELSRKIPRSRMDILSSVRRRRRRRVCNLMCIRLTSC